MRIEKLYIIPLMVVFGGIVLHAPLSVSLGTLFPRYSLLIKSWKEIIMLLLVPLAIYLMSKRRLWHELANDWLMRLIAGYAALHLLTILFLFQGAKATAAGLLIDLRYLLFFCLVYVGMRLWSSFRPLFIKVGVIGACIVVGFAVIQLFLPPDFLKIIGYGRDTIEPYLTVDKNPEFIRVNSTLRGPNPLGAYAGIVLGLVAAAFMKGKVILQSRLAVPVGLLTACSLVALWVSYSRSALIAAAITILVVIGIAFRQRVSKRVWVGGVVALGLIVGILVSMSSNNFVSNVILHENLQGGSSISSNEGHLQSLTISLSQLLRQPFGAGVGSTGSASLFGGSALIVENQYLFIAHEAGWLGFTLFLAVFTLTMRRLWQRRQDWLGLGVFASGLGLAFIGLLLPVWTDDTVSIVWWGLAAIVLGGKKDE